MSPRLLFSILCLTVVSGWKKWQQNCPSFCRLVEENDVTGKIYPVVCIVAKSSRNPSNSYPSLESYLRERGSERGKVKPESMESWILRLKLHHLSRRPLSFCLYLLFLFWKDRIKNPRNRKFSKNMHLVIPNTHLHSLTQTWTHTIHIANNQNCTLPIVSRQFSWKYSSVSFTSSYLHYPEKWLLETVRCWILFWVKSVQNV